MNNKIAVVISQTPRKITERIDIDGNVIESNEPLVEVLKDASR